MKEIGQSNHHDAYRRPHFDHKCDWPNLMPTYNYGIIQEHTGRSPKSPKRALTFYAEIPRTDDSCLHQWKCGQGQINSIQANDRKKRQSLHSSLRLIHGLCISTTSVVSLTPAGIHANVRLET